jgi:phospholipid/cholesterol/gamma-HCH transport system substrate-binding protein
MSRKGKARELTVGITLTLALALFAGIVTMLGEQTRMLRPRITYTTKVSNSLGLKAGSPVLMGGVQIGTILSVDLPRDLKGTGIDVALGVDHAFQDRIRLDSKATVGFITLLSGEKFVDISAGDPAQPAMLDGGFIPPAKSETLFEAGQNVADNVGAVSEQLKEILAKLNAGEGLLGRIVTQKDPYFGQDVMERLNTTLERTNSVLDRVDRGEGVAGRLLSDKQYADETLGSIRSAAARLDRVLELIETKQGAAGELIQPDGTGRQILDDLKATTASLRKVSERLEGQTGLLGRLLNDPEYSEAVARDLHAISQSLASILGKVDRGEGTVGGLVNDPAVYQGLKDVVKGIQSSKTAKSVVRHYGNKGAKLQDKEPPEPKPQPLPAPDSPPAVPPPPGEGGGSGSPGAP